jgi:tRNA (pseudouridine54-N1)-methyltransferase
MRNFIFVSHTVPVDAQWNLKDLCGAAGRVDVLCRALQSTLFLSHDLRQDTKVTFIFHNGPATAVQFDASVNRLNPDERSTAARIQQALQARHDDPWWEEIQQGINVAPYTLAEVLEEMDGTIVVLDKDGSHLEETTLPVDPIFVMGDHQPLTEAELAPTGDAMRVSLGPVWYHGNHVASILQYKLDL